MKVEHIGIAVKSIQESNRVFSILLNTSPYKEEIVEGEKVKTSFFQTGESKIELLEAIGGEGPIADFINKKGEGMHHIAFEVDDIYAEMKRLKAQGFKLLNDEPKKGADNKLICFVHPKTANGVLVEICQTIVSPEA